MAARQYREMDITTCGTHTIQDAVEIVSDIPAVLQDIVPGMWHSNLAAETCTKSGPCGVADGRFQAERGDQGLYLVIMGVSQHARQYIVGSRDTLATDTGRMICIRPRWLHAGGIFAVGKLSALRASGYSERLQARWGPSGRNSSSAGRTLKGTSSIQAGGATGAYCL